MALYRKNKYNESIEVYRYECGSCANYEFEREDRDNYCKHYGKYYPYRDSCRGYWTEFSEESTGCFLTTACCQYKGLPDDCYELQVMRAFRDTKLKQSEDGKELIAEYYQIAPIIVEKLKDSPDRDRYFEGIYREIKTIIGMIENGSDDKAVNAYVGMVRNLQEKLM